MSAIMPDIGVRGEASALLLALLCAAAGVAAAIAVAYWSFSEGRAVLEDRFEHWSSERCAQVLDRLVRHLEDLEAVGRFFEGSEFVDPAEFKRFVTPLLEGNTGFAAVAWAPRITETERAAFESAMGAGGRQIQQLSETGLQTAPSRPEYFPIAYAEPHSQLDDLMALDLLGCDGPGAALRHMIKTLQTSVSEEVLLPHSPEPLMCVPIVIPVQKLTGQNTGAGAAPPPIQGCVVGALSVSQTIEALLRDTQPIGLPFDLWDLSSPQNKRLLYRHVDRLDGSTTAPNDDDEDLTHAHDLLYGGRTWRLVIEASPAFIAKNKMVWPSFVLPLGLCMAALAALIVYTLSQRREYAERVAAQRSDTIQGILQAIPDTMLRLDASGRILEAHAPEPAIFTTPLHSLAAALIEEAFPVDVVNHLKPVIQDVLRTRRNQSVEYEIPADAGARSFEARFAPCGERETILIIRDITDRKRAEAEHIDYERQLLHAQKLESLGVLAGGIAHDFNNLLMAILGYTDMAQRDATDPAQVVHYLQEVEKASLRAAELCKQMLAYAGKGRFVVEDVDLNEIILDSMPLMRASVSKKAQLALQLHPGRAMVRADATQLRQVLMNLVTNASESLEDRDGRIRIATDMVTVAQAAPHTFGNDDPPLPNAYVVLEVSDDGCGMDQETLRRMFEPFFTTKFTGRGLGLAAVQGIVNGHNGQLDVQSTPDRGTTFRIHLPALVPPKTPYVSSDSEPAHESVLPGGSILLVDDEDIVLNLGKKMLERLGFAVITARDGIEAIEVFKASQSEIQAVVLDLTMPRMDGEEAFRELKRIDPAVRVILSSGFNEQETVERFLGLGLAAFVQKPYRLADLRRAFSGVFARNGEAPRTD